MADDADQPNSEEQREGARPEEASWPPSSGLPDENGPAAADQPTPELPTGPWQGEPTGTWWSGGEAQDPWSGRDETVIHPAAPEETSALPPLDPNATSMIPPAGGPQDPTGRWAARAGVPPAGAREDQQEWEAVEETRGGAWWMPILIGIIILILLALLGVGLWLAFGNDRGGPGPVQSPTSSPTASSPTPSPSPSPTPSPTPSASPSAAMVTLPSLRGVSAGDAAQVLTGLGLKVQVQMTPDDTVPAGSVVRTQPDANSQVPVGGTVVLFVASAPSPSPSPSLELPLPSPSAS